MDLIIEQINEEVSSSECTSTNDEGTLVYAFEYSNDYFKTGISLYTFNYYSGYVDIVKTPDGYKYVITISDGKYGFKNVAYEDMNIKSIKKIGPIENIPANSVSCD